MSKRKSAVEAMLEEGRNAIERSFTMAKAVQPDLDDDDGDGDLDGDFADYDQAKQESDAANEGREEESDWSNLDDSGDDDGDDEFANHYGDDDEEEEDDEDDEEGELDGVGTAMSKAQVVDAMPILAVIEARLARLEGLDSRLEGIESQQYQLGQTTNRLAKAVQEGATGNMTMAKAVAAAINVPLPTVSQRSRRVGVPTKKAAASSGGNPSTVLAKAVQACEKDTLSVGEVAEFEQRVNQFGLEEALSQMPAVATAVKD